MNRIRSALSEQAHEFGQGRQNTAMIASAIARAHTHTHIIHFGS
jgi:hypothetical protein